MQNKMSELYELTKKFNDISGANKELSLKAMREQFLYIDEEVNEIRDALNTDNLTEVLDGCIDTIITVFGLLQKLENLGVDINQAAIGTALNNLSKYPSPPAVAHETVERKRLEGVETKAAFNEAENCYAIRNVNTGKIIKPYNFVSNDLSKFITTEVKEKYAKSV